MWRTPRGYEQAQAFRIDAWRKSEYHCLNFAADLLRGVDTAAHVLNRVIWGVPFQCMLPVARPYKFVLIVLLVVAIFF